MNRQLFQLLRSRQFWWQILILIGYAVPFFFFIETWQRFLLFVIGLVVGNFILILDANWLYQFYQEEGKEKQERAGTKPTINLITRSLLFLVVLVPVAFFTITSTGSPVGGGLVLSLFLLLGLEMLQYRTDPLAFRNRFLFQLKTKLKPMEQNLLIVLTFAIWLLFSLLVAF